MMSAAVSLRLYMFFVFLSPCVRVFSLRHLRLATQPSNNASKVRESASGKGDQLGLGE